MVCRSLVYAHYVGRIGKNGGDYTYQSHRLETCLVACAAQKEHSDNRKYYGKQRCWRNLLLKSEKEYESYRNRVEETDCGCYSRGYVKVAFDKKERSGCIEYAQNKDRE